MASKDTITKNYMRNPRHFADFFNGYVYKGEEVLKAEKLSEVDTSNIAIIPYNKNMKGVSVQRYRDAIKKAILMEADNAYYLILGIENQTDVHYAMPVRNMLYDALVYSQQVETISKRNRDEMVCHGSAEFLSGMTSDDRLIPVITVTIYWGAESWSAPTTLKEMLIDVDDKAKVYINDYDCHLFSIVDTKELPRFKTELNELLQVLRLRNDSKSFNDLVINNKAYQNIDKETAVMMSELASVKLPRKSKEGRYNMCKAVMEIAEEGRKEGLKEGRKEGLKEGRKEGLKEGRKEGLKEGRKEGIRDAQKVIIENMLKKGMSIEDAAMFSGCSIELVQKIQKDMLVII